MSALLGKRDRDQTAPTQDEPVAKRQKSNQPYGGKDNYQYSDLEVVWARLEDFPWWPGQVDMTHLPNGDRGRLNTPRLPIKWFGEDSHLTHWLDRTRISPFDVNLEDRLIRDIPVEDEDLPEYNGAVEDAINRQKKWISEKKREAKRKSKARDEEYNPNRHRRQRHSRRISGDESSTNSDEYGFMADSNGDEDYDVDRDILREKNKLVVQKEDQVGSNSNSNSNSNDNDETLLIGDTTDDNLHNDQLFDPIDKSFLHSNKKHQDEDYSEQDDEQDDINDEDYEIPSNSNHLKKRMKSKSKSKLKKKKIYVQPSSSSSESTQPVEHPKPKLLPKKLKSLDEILNDDSNTRKLMQLLETHQSSSGNGNGKDFLVGLPFKLQEEMKANNLSLPTPSFLNEYYKFQNDLGWLKNYKLRKQKKLKNIFSNRKLREISVKKAFQKKKVRLLLQRDDEDKDKSEIIYLKCASPKLLAEMSFSSSRYNLKLHRHILTNRYHSMANRQGFFESDLFQTLPVSVSPPLSIGVETAEVEAVEAVEAMVENKENKEVSTESTAVVPVEVEINIDKEFAAITPEAVPIENMFEPVDIENEKVVDVETNSNTNSNALESKPEPTGTELEDNTVTQTETETDVDVDVDVVIEDKQEEQKPALQLERKTTDLIQVINKETQDKEMEKDHENANANAKPEIEN